MKKSMKPKFKNSDSVKELVYKAAELSKIWSEFANSKGEHCTIGELVHLANPKVENTNIYEVAINLIPRPEEYPFSPVSPERSRYDSLIRKTEGRDRQKAIYETDKKPKNFVPPQKRKKVVRDLANLLCRNFKTVGELRERINELYNG